MNTERGQYEPAQRRTVRPEQTAGPQDAVHRASRDELQSAAEEVFEQLSPGQAHRQKSNEARSAQEVDVPEESVRAAVGEIVRLNEVSASPARRRAAALIKSKVLESPPDPSLVTS